MLLTATWNMKRATVSDTKDFFRWALFPFSAVDEHFEERHPIRTAYHELIRRMGRVAQHDETVGGALRWDRSKNDASVRRDNGRELDPKPSGVEPPHRDTATKIPSVVACLSETDRRRVRHCSADDLARFWGKLTHRERYLITRRLQELSLIHI